MDIDVCIISVLSRRKSAERVADAVGIPYDKIIYDNRGRSGGGDAWYNARRAWLTTSEDATHRMILQDDIIPCDDFLNIVRRCVQRLPDCAWTFYNGVWVTEAMKRLSTPYVRLNGCRVSGQALLLPREHIEPMIKWTDGFFGEAFKHDDARVGVYCLMNDLPMMGTIPSLCQHDMNVDSVIPNHNRKDRISPTFRKDVLDEAWDSDEINHTPIMTNDVWMPERSAKKQFCDARIREKCQEIRKCKK